MKPLLAYRWAESVEDVRGVEGCRVPMFPERVVRVDGDMVALCADDDDSAPVGGTFHFIELLGGVLVPEAADDIVMDFGDAIDLAVAMASWQWRVVSVIEILPPGSSKALATLRYIDGAPCLRLSDAQNTPIPDKVSVRIVCNTHGNGDAAFVLAPPLKTRVDPLAALHQGLAEGALAPVERVEDADVSSLPLQPLRPPVAVEHVEHAGRYAEELDLADCSVDQVATLYDKRGKPVGTAHIVHKRYTSPRLATGVLVCPQYGSSGTFYRCAPIAVDDWPRFQTRLIETLRKIHQGTVKPV